MGKKKRDKCRVSLSNQEQHLIQNILHMTMKFLTQKQTSKFTDQACYLHPCGQIITDLRDPFQMFNINDAHGIIMELPFLPQL